MRVVLVKVVLLTLALLLAAAVCWAFWPGRTEAQERTGVPRLEIVAEDYWEEDDFNFEERLAKARAEEGSGQGPRAVAESETVREDLYEAALTLQPSLRRKQRHARRTVDIIFTAAVEHDVDPFLALAFASRESGLRANARGKLDEQGLYQLHGYARRKCAGRRDLGQPRVNAEAFGCWWTTLRDLCATEDLWVLTAAYGTGKCLNPAKARRLACTKRKRAELVRAVGAERAGDIWPL